MSTLYTSQFHAFKSVELYAEVKACSHNNFIPCTAIPNNYPTCLCKDPSPSTTTTHNNKTNDSIFHDHQAYIDSTDYLIATWSWLCPRSTNIMTCLSIKESLCKEHIDMASTWYSNLSPRRIPRDRIGNCGVIFCHNFFEPIQELVCKIHACWSIL